MTVSRFVKKYAIVIVLIILIIAFGIAAPAFAQFNNAMNIIRQISMMGIVSVGFSFVLIGGGLDLSIGGQIAIMNVVASMLIRDLECNAIVAILIGIALTTFIGWFNGFLITKTNIPPLIETFGMMTMLRGICYLLSKGRPIYGVPDYIKPIGQASIFGTIPVPGIIMIVVIVFGALLLSKTYWGRHFFALGSNAEAARLSGINIHFTRALSYTLCGFLTGIAAMVWMCRVGSGQPNAADGFEMNVLTACVIGGISINGGKGSIFGAIVGTCIIGVLNNGMSIAGANDYWQRVILGIVLILVVVFDSLSQRGKNKA